MPQTLYSKLDLDGVLLLAEDTPIVVFTDPWIFADRLIFRLLVIINFWEYSLIGTHGPAEKNLAGATEFTMIGILSICVD
jgi:hypothetical protein